MANQTDANPNPSDEAPEKRVRPGTWCGVASLARDALAALEAGNAAEARRCLQAIRAVAMNALGGQPRRDETS